MIGSMLDADAAISGEAMFLAEGSARAVYVLNNVVYKIETESGCNDFEYDNLVRLGSVTLPDGIALPAWNVFTVDGIKIIAMEYIDGTPVGECYCDWAGTECNCPTDSKAPLGILTACRNLGIEDLAVGNLIYRDGVYYLVDLEG